MPEDPKIKNTLEEEIKQQLTPEKPPEFSHMPANNGPIKSLRTYQGDIENVVGNKKTSIASIAIAEHKRQEERRETTPQTQSFFTELTNKSFLTAGIGLVILGLVIVGAGYIIKSLDFSSPTPEKITVVSFTKKIDVPIASSTRARLIDSILAVKNNPGGQNSLVYFNPIDKSEPAHIADVLNLLTPHIPQSLTRSLDTQYMIGVYTFDTSEPFIILTTADFALSYSGMLKWEESMAQDLGEIFSISTNNASNTPVFTDEAINNKDLRVLTDGSKKTVLLYSFLDKNTILITANESIFTALLNKFVTSKMVR